ncbi:LuxS/MPP-like metallohydrolase [Dentipellis sp. KUC8613]|nr:LuxS/MPP-like metallohydrolase [Dentipellis sp. KUC8613]
MLRATRLARSTVRSFATVVDAAGGARVAAADNGQATSSVTVLLKAGSRYEPKPGVAHVLSNFAFKSTEKRSALGTLREAELYGGVLSATLTREHLALTAEFLRGDEAFFVDVLASFLSSARFTRHELEEYVLPSVLAEAEAAGLSPSTNALELAHALAFRNGLGASLFADAEATSDITSADVRALSSAALADPSSVAVLGTGISADALAALFSKSFAPSASAPATTPAAAPKSAYHGGASRVKGAHGPQTVFVGFGTANAANVPALHALAGHVSPAPATKWAQGASPLAAAIPEGVFARTVLLPYSDAALFGLLVEGEDAKAVGAAAKSAVELLKATAGGNVAKEEVQRAVARARFAVAAGVETREGLVNAVGARLLAGEGASVQSTLDAVEKVDGAAISKIAGELLKGKPTFVAVGDVNSLPYADEIGLTNA